MILTASSAKEALEEVAEALHAEGGPRLTVSPGGSNALARQVAAGVEADLFLSADQAWADELAGHQLAARTAALLSGRLVVVVPVTNPAKVQSPEDLMSERVRRIALAGEQVPAGRYAEQALRGRGLYESLIASGRIVRGENVRFALAFVERGEVEAGIVYASDAAASGNVEVACVFEASDHAPIVYPLVLLRRGADRPVAREAFEFLRSSRAGAIFEKHGFGFSVGAEP